MSTYVPKAMLAMMYEKQTEYAIPIVPKLYERSTLLSVIRVIAQKMFMMKHCHIFPMLYMDNSNTLESAENIVDMANIFRGNDWVYVLPYNPIRLSLKMYRQAANNEATNATIMIFAARVFV